MIHAAPKRLMHRALSKQADHAATHTNTHTHDEVQGKNTPQGIPSLQRPDGREVGPCQALVPTTTTNTGPHLHVSARQWWAWSLCLVRRCGRCGRCGGRGGRSPFWESARSNRVSECFFSFLNFAVSYNRPLKLRIYQRVVLLWFLLVPFAAFTSSDRGSNRS